MPQARTYQCPNCNGVLRYDNHIGKLTCDHCGGVFEEGEATAAIPTDSAPVEQAETEHVKTVDEFLEHAPWDLESAGLNVVDYSCPSCGATVVADQSTVSTTCPYCGNNMLVQGIATGENVPAYVLPFTIDKKTAQSKMNEHFQSKWYLPRAFAASLEHMQAVYVPYHLYDIDVDGWADYIAYNRVQSENSTYYYYHGAQRAAEASFVKIPVDGSSKMPDGHMDAIAPFDFGKLRPFSAEYIAGYLTEVPDEDAEQCYPKAERLAKGSFENDMANDVVRSEKKIDGIEKVIKHETNIHRKGTASCVLPVWLAHCTWEAHDMLFAVNGDTGRCVGDLPVSRVKRWGTVLGVGIVLAVIAVFLIIAWLNASKHGNSDVIKDIVGFAVVATFLVPWLIDKYFMAQMRTANEATDAKMSYDSDGLVVTKRWFNKKRYGSVEKAERKMYEKLGEEARGELDGKTHIWDD